jgi:LEA14-like dessication related protein
MSPSHQQPRLRHAALAIVIVTAGCRAAVDRVFTQPTVALRGVAVTGVGLEGATLGVTLAVVNPNPFPLTASRASYRLLAGDSVEVGQGVATESLRVGGRDSALVVLPLDVTWAGVARAGRGALRGGTVEYRVLGEVVASTPLGDRAIPLDARGRFAPPRVGR